MVDAAVPLVQCFGRKKTAMVVTHNKRGQGLIKINSCLGSGLRDTSRSSSSGGTDSGVDMRIRVKGGGHTSQIYAIHKYINESLKKEIKDILVRHDRTLLVANHRHCEPKKFGGRGARARFQKSYH